MFGVVNFGVLIVSSVVFTVFYVKSVSRNRSCDRSAFALPYVQGD